MRFPLVDNAYAGISNAFQSSRSINLYVEMATGEGAKGPAMLIGTPGFKYLGNVGAPVRALRVFNNQLFSVVGAELVTINPQYPWSVLNSIGSLNTQLGSLSIRDNGLEALGIGGNQLVIMDGKNGYVYNVSTSAFSTIATTGGFPSNPSFVEYIDGYFIVINGTMAAAATDLFDVTTTNALASAQISATPGTVQAVLASREILYFIKNDSIEAWYNAAVPTSQGFPFQRMQGAVIGFGTIAPHTWLVLDDTFYGLATVRTSNGIQQHGVVQLVNGSINLISPVAVNNKINKTTATDYVFAYAYSENGHPFYVITNVTQGWTWAYDIMTNIWHERSSYTGSPFAVGAQMPLSYAYFNNMHIVGDINGNLYEMNSNYFSEAGNPIVKTRVMQPLYDKKSLEKVALHRLTLDCQTGVGTESSLSPAVAICGLDGAGAVQSVVVSDGGADYFNNTAPTVLAIPIDGQGSGADLTAVMANGSVASVTVNSGGSGYNFPPEIVFSGPVIDSPSVTLSTSKDGVTWNNERSRSLGAAGEQNRKVFWDRVGASTNTMIYRLACTDCCKFNLFGAYIQ